MMNKQIETLKATIADLQDRVREIEADLSVQVIDGTPFVLGITITRPELFPGSGTEDRMLHGLWETEDGIKKGWKHEEAVPSHRGGMTHVSRENAKANMVHLRAQGYRPFYMHYRDFLTARLARTKEVIGHLEAAIVRVEGGAK